MIVVDFHRERAGHSPTAIEYLLEGEKVVASDDWGNEEGVAGRTEAPQLCPSQHLQGSPANGDPGEGDTQLTN